MSNKKGVRTGARPWVSKACRIISLVMVFLLGITAVVMLLPSIIGVEPLIVLSNSMEPTFSTGDMIYVKAVPPAELEVGDVITFVIEGSQTRTTHRVVQLLPEEGAVVTKGDANNVDDGQILYKRIVGRKVFRVPKLGYYVGFIRGPEGLLLLGGLLVLLIAAILLLQILGKKQKSPQVSGKARVRWTDRLFRQKRKNPLLSTELLSREAAENKTGSVLELTETPPQKRWRAKIVDRSSRKIHRREQTTAARSTPPDHRPPPPPTFQAKDRPDVEDILAELHQKRKNRTLER